MIICPNCKSEIEEQSHYCDQCGQALRYCTRCGRVGIGRRCTNCGGMMAAPGEQNKNLLESQNSFVTSLSYTLNTKSNVASHRYESSPVAPSPVAPPKLIKLLLSNESLKINIEGVNGAVIGRRQGPYTQYFQNNMYVSGVHAQLRYNMTSGWCITDKHSSNGTKLNSRALQPDVEMSLKDGDILTIANVNLKVSLLA